MHAYSALSDPWFVQRNRSSRQSDPAAITHRDLNAAQDPTFSAGMDRTILFWHSRGRVLNPLLRVTMPCSSGLLWLVLFAQDSSGLFHWLGSRGHQQATQGSGSPSAPAQGTTARRGSTDHSWKNPCRAGAVKVVCSAPPSRYCNPEAVVERAFHTTWYTSGRPQPWIAVHLLVTFRHTAA